MTPSQLSTETLARAELLLTARIGPVAKVLVRRAAREASDEQSLYLRLAAELDDESERATFVAEAGAEELLFQPEPALGAAEGRGPIEELPEELLRVAQFDLAQCLGPIASILVKRAAKQATDARHFYRLLALEISDPTDRRRFLLTC